MTRWLVTGAKGFLGTNTAVGLQGRVETVGLARTDFTTADYSRTEILDLRDSEALAEIIRNVRPDVIVHGAAIRCYCCRVRPYRHEVYRSYPSRGS